MQKPLKGNQKKNDTDNFLGSMNLPPFVQGAAIRGLSKYFLQHGHKSCIVVYDESKIVNDEKATAFSCVFSPVNVVELMNNFEEIKKLYNDMKSRNNFLEDYRNKNEGLPTRKQQAALDEGTAMQPRKK